MVRQRDGSAFRSRPRAWSHTLRNRLADDNHVRTGDGGDRHRPAGGAAVSGRQPDVVAPIRYSDREFTGARHPVRAGPTVGLPRVGAPGAQRCTSTGPVARERRAPAAGTGRRVDTLPTGVDQRRSPVDCSRSDWRAQLDFGRRDTGRNARAVSVGRAVRSRLPRGRGGRRERRASAVTGDAWTSPDWRRHREFLAHVRQCKPRCAIRNLTRGDGATARGSCVTRGGEAPSPGLEPGTTTLTAWRSTS